MSDFDLLVCGGGPVGCTVANRAANLLGWKVLVIDRRHHLAGNCYDENHSSGVMIHRYGPHYFRTNNEDLFNFLSQFTDWIPGNYFVKSFIRGELFPFPINLLTLEQFFRRSFTEDEARKFLADKSEKIPNPQNSEEVVVSQIGWELYEAFFKGYTLKQWDMHPKELAPSVCARIPLRFNTDSRYVDHKYQVTPKHGFSKLFQNMITHPNIEVMLNAEFAEVRKTIKPKHATLYCGPIDEYFQNTLGPLPWRSLSFRFVEYQQNLFQPCVQINYPHQAYACTRSVEIKHVTMQQCPNTVISYERPCSGGDPYYPIPSSSSAKLFELYSELAADEERAHSVYFAGRLANYTYINTDQAIELGLNTFEKIKRRHISEYSLDAT